MSIKRCSIEGCDSPYVARGWCRVHYYRWQKSGDPLAEKKKASKCPPGCACGRHGEIFKKKDKVLSSPCKNCEEIRLVHPCHGPGQEKEKKFCNRSCWDEHQRKQMAERRSKGIVRRYDMSAEEFEARLATQKSRCAICLKTIGHSAHRDHCHTSGEWRGLLCSNCNIGLGNFQDDPDNLLRAWQYLVMGGVPVAAEA